MGFFPGRPRILAADRVKSVADDLDGAVNTMVSHQSNPTNDE
jgi:hypothetical protein